MIPPYRMNEAAKSILKFAETGNVFRTEAYWDKYGEVWTIGFGFTKGVKEGDTMTEEEGEARLNEEAKEYEQGVWDLCTLPPNENQFSAMVCLCWNIGLNPEKGFPISDVLKYHNLGNFERAAVGFKSWTKSGGVRLPGLVLRRAKEAKLYLTPV